MVAPSGGRRTAATSTEDVALTDEQKKTLRQRLPAHSVVDTKNALPSVAAFVDSSEQEMDTIRARSILPFTYNYNPPENIDKIMKEVIDQLDVSLTSDGQFGTLSNKTKILKALGAKLQHYVLSAQLQYINDMRTLRDFYVTPVHNTTEYARMARDTSMPPNLAVREQPVRFHPNDTEAVHGGVNALPGEGGKVFGLRNKRIYRQFRPKQNWYDYDEQNFDHEPASTGMPWDPAIANKMDRYTDRKFMKNRFVQLK